jgi:hypothetical protein
MKPTKSLSVFGSVLCIALVFSIAASDAIAVPVSQTPVNPDRQTTSATQAQLEPFFNYLHQQKYTLALGSDRGACEYAIDPTDVYAQGNNRFVTAKISRGSNVGTGCRGILEFTVLQANCPENKLYQFVRETAGDIRFSGWQRLELFIGTDAATQVCDLPTRAE